MSETSNQPLDPTEILRQYANYVGANAFVLDDLSLAVLHGAVSAEMNRRRATQGVPPIVGSVATTAEVSAEPTNPEGVDNYYAGLRELVAPEGDVERAMSVKRQLIVMGAFWEQRGLKVPKLSPEELKNYQKMAEQNPGLRLIPTPLPFDTDERGYLFLDNDKVDEELDEDSDNSDDSDSSDNDPFMDIDPAYSPGEELSLVKGPVYSRYADALYEGKIAYCELDAKGKQIKGTQTVESSLCYKGLDGKPIFGRQAYLRHLVESGRGRDYNNGRLVWTFQFVDLSRLTSANTERTPLEIMPEVDALATPELEMTIGQLRNEAGVYDANRLNSDNGIVYHLVNETFATDDARIYYFGTVSHKTDLAEDGRGVYAALTSWKTPRSNVLVTRRVVPSQKTS